MGESSIKLSARFSDEKLAKKVESLLLEGQKEIFASFDKGDELYLHDFLSRKNETMEISFDSWWVPEKIERDNDSLKLELSGSPSGTKEQDIITWLKLVGAKDINGEMSIGGADPETWEV